MSPCKVHNPRQGNLNTMRESASPSRFNIEKPDIVNTKLESI